MKLLYNIGIRVYYILVLIVSLVNKKASLWIKGRKNIFKSLRKNIGEHDKIAWFHVSSLGEFEQGRPIIEAFRQNKPDYKILITFFSPSGYEIRKDYPGADYVYYLPLDTHRNAKKFIQIVKPKLLILVKYDYWYNHLKQAKKNGTKLILISGAFRKNQAFFKWYGGWYRQILKWFDHLFVQYNDSFDQLQRINITKCSVSGDSRFDRVVDIAAKGKEIPVAKEFSLGHTTIVCGSTWPLDEEHLLRYIAETDAKIKVILAPHEIHASHIEAIKKESTVPYSLFSEAENSDLKNAKVLIIDNIGLLSSLYKYGHIAYIGGGFGVGIHNTLEAAVYGIPVLFGPNYNKFREAKDLIKCNGARSFSTYEEFKNTIDQLISKNSLLEGSGKAAARYVKDMTGATDLIINSLEKI